MPIFMFDVFNEICVAVTVEVIVRIGWHVNDTVTGSSDPSGKHSVTEFLCVFVLSFRVHGDSEHLVPRLLIGRLNPFKPSAESVIIRESIFISSHYV